jgi:hypothetical protein
MATEFLPTLDLAEEELHEALDGISGARVEPETLFPSPRTTAT